MLYDRPLKAKGVVRVAGPFTVESLSPHRVLPLEEDPFLAEMLEADGCPSPVRERGGVRVLPSGEDPHPAASRHRLPNGRRGATTDFAQVVYDNLSPPACRTPRKARRSSSNG